MTTCHSPMARNDDSYESCKNAPGGLAGPVPCTCGHGTCAILGFCIREKSRSLPREGPASPVERDRLKLLCESQSSFKVLHVSETEELHEVEEIIQDKFKISRTIIDEQSNLAHQDVAMNVSRKSCNPRSSEKVHQEKHR
mmetsp:Transcript_40847/g.128670  ORF Transcript_40847/g.128670 Transcript_40847/m.128670 type:complete len:140 (-) Transcript_40847:2386-2805(-)